MRSTRFSPSSRRSAWSGPSRRPSRAGPAPRRSAASKGINAADAVPPPMVLFAKDILEPEFLSERPDTTLLEAAKAMADRRQGFVIVTSPEGRPIGIVTEWDILAKVVAGGRDPATVPGPEISGPIAALEFAASGDRPAAPHLAGVNRLEPGEELNHLGERPEGSLAFPDPRILVHEGAVPIPEPFFVVDPDHDRLVSQFPEFVASDDAWSEGVRPVFARRGAHPSLRRRHLEIPRRKVVEDRDAEQMLGSLRG